MFLCHSCRQGFDWHRCIPDGTFRTLPECQSKVNCCFGSPNYGSNHRLILNINEIRQDFTEPLTFAFNFEIAIIFQL